MPCNPAVNIPTMGAAARATDEHLLARSRRRRSTIWLLPALNFFPFSRGFCQVILGMGLCLLMSPSKFYSRADDPRTSSCKAPPPLDLLCRHEFLPPFLLLDL
jgi:hypothetical protein